MSRKQNQNQKKGKKGQPAYFFLGLVPFLLVLAVNILASFGALVCIVIDLVRTQGVGDFSMLQSQALEAVMEHGMEFTILFQIPALLFIFLWYWFTYAKKKKLIRQPCTFSFRQSLPVIALLALGASQLVGLVMYAESVLFPAAMRAYEQLMESTGIGGTGLAVFISTILLAPLMEELTFRGLTVQILKRTGWQFWIINIIQAALFGLFHMNLIQGIYAFLLGLLLGYICEKYGSLLAAIVLHACFNVCGSYLQSLLDLWLKNTKTMLPNVLLGIAGGVLVVLALWLLRKEIAGKQAALASLPEREEFSVSDAAGAEERN